MHSEEPAPLKVPAAHGRQSDMSVAAKALNVPAGQGIGSKELPGQYEPSGQASEVKKYPIPAYCTVESEKKQRPRPPPKTP